MAHSSARSKRRALPVVIVLAAGAGLACVGGGSNEPIGFDASTGCCRYSCGNGCGVEDGDCPDTGAHGDACCTLTHDSGECDTDPADTDPADTADTAP